VASGAHVDFNFSIRCRSKPRRAPSGRCVEQPRTEGDLKGAVEDGMYAGLPTEQIATLIGEALDQSEILMKQPNIQRAVLAVAKAIPVSGRLKGQRAVFIINRALAAVD